MTIDLTTHFGSLTLSSPIIVGACPMAAHELTRIALISAGAGAIVLPSLFEEQVRLWNQDNGLSDSAGTDFDQSVLRHDGGEQNALIPDAKSYLALVERASASASVPIVASINGECRGQWLAFALQLESAGASAIEFNIRRQPPHLCSNSHEVEVGIVNLANKVSQSISIPLFLKLGRHYTSLSHLAVRLLKKADGLVLFGYAPEVDISVETLQAKTRWGLTEPGSVARFDRGDHARPFVLSRNVIGRQWRNR